MDPCRVLIHQNLFYRILSMLDYQDLENCKQVSVEWKAAAKITELFYNFPKELQHDRLAPMVDPGTLYVYTNELGSDKTLSKLIKIPLRGNAIIGVSGLFTLNVVCARQKASIKHPSEREIDYLIMVDEAKIVQQFWNDIKEVFVLAKGREDFLENFKKCLLIDKRNYLSEDSHYGWFEQNVSSLSRSFEWLYSENFKKIHRIFKKNRFLFLPLDLKDKKNCAKLGRILQEQSIEVDTIYTSNIKDFLRPNEFEFFGDSITSLIKPGTIVVDTLERPYKITKRFDFFCIHQFFLLNKSGGFVSPKPIQQVQNFSSSRELLPILKLADEFKVSEKSFNYLFYEYGLTKSYYNEEESENIYTKSQFMLDEGVDFMQVLAFECDKFYPKISNLSGNKRVRKKTDVDG